MRPPREGLECSCCIPRSRRVRSRRPYRQDRWLHPRARSPCESGRWVGTGRTIVTAWKARKREQNREATKRVRSRSDHVRTFEAAREFTIRRAFAAMILGVAGDGGAMIRIPEAAKRDPAAVCKRLYERGLVAGADGNVSIRISKDQLLATLQVWQGFRDRG